jgi:hypothetical protein
MRGTTSVLMGMSKAKAICCAIGGPPQAGFRRFMSMTAATTSWLGPRGPGFFRALGDNSSEAEIRCPFPGPVRKCAMI